MSQTAIEKMRAHVAQLTATHRVTILFKDDQDDNVACACHQTREIVARTITTASHYATVLHEMGHIVIVDEGLFPPDTPSVNLLIEMRVATKVDLRFAVANETAAWAWAQQNAILWTPEMETDRRTALASYEDGLAHAPDLPHPFALFALTMNKYLPARVWARKRMLETIADVASDAAQREKAVAHLRKVWTEADHQLEEEAA